MPGRHPAGIEAAAKTSQSRAVAIPFFFYGTLMDIDLLRAVASGTVTHDRMMPAVLNGFRRSAVDKQAFPVVTRRSGGRVSGLLVLDMNELQLCRLIAYEGPSYRAMWVLVRSQKQGSRWALTFVGNPAKLTPLGAAWSFARWVRRSKSRTLRRAAHRAATLTPGLITRQLECRWVSLRQALYASRSERPTNRAR